MPRVEVVQELFVTAQSRVGLLAQVTDSISQAGVDIHAIGAYDKEGRGELMLITSDNEKAAVALGQIVGMKVERNDVVVVDLPARPGALAEAAKKLAHADINVDWVYGTAADGNHAMVVFKVADPHGAAEALRGM